jgi:hypothetical protein
MSTATGLPVADLPANALAKLAAAAPPRKMSRAETMYVAELQAQLLLEWAMVLEAPVPNALLEGIPGVELLWISEPRLVAAVNGKKGWRLIVTGADADTPESERFAVAYGLKKVLDIPPTRRCYGTAIGRVRPENTPAYRFATSLLMPKTWLLQAWKDLQGDERLVAERFGVEQIHVQARLDQLGIC